MSKFSEQCKKLLTENGMNVYRLSKDFSLECTTLQRMVTGKRLPNIDFVKKFCDVLRIPFTEKQNLLELYRIEQIGETVYNNRKSIKTLLDNLALNEKSLSKEILTFPDSNYYHNQSIISYSYKIERLIQSILQQAFIKNQNSFIYTNFPAYTFSFFHQLRLLNAEFKNSNVIIKHLINFKIDANDTIFNLNILNNVLPFTLSNQLNYQSLFCYSRLNVFDFLQIIFPYFIITDDEVLLLSSSMQNAVQLSDADIVMQYRLEFEKMAAHCNPLIHCTNQLDEAWKEYSQLHTSTHKHFYTIEPSICCTKIMNIEDFDSLLDQQLDEFNVDVVQIIQYQKTLKSTSFFSKQGIQMFCETGKLTGQMGALLPAMNIEQRKAYLEKFLKQDVQCYMLHDTFRLNFNLNLEVCGRDRINIIYFDPENIFNIRFVSIDESSICNAFYDFTESLVGSDSIFTKEETKDEISKILKEKFPEE